jgi:hypothetical protein
MSNVMIHTPSAVYASTTIAAPAATPATVHAPFLSAVAAATNESGGPKMPPGAVAPGTGAPSGPFPPPSTEAVAVGSVVGVVELELVEAVPLPLPLPEVAAGLGVMVKTWVTTDVVDCRPLPRPMLVESEVESWTDCVCVWFWFWDGDCVEPWDWEPPWDWLEPWVEFWRAMADQGGSRV